MPSSATRIHFAFLLSGAAGLIFELLWFRLLGFSLGNSLWSVTAVLTAFMTGLALGNGLAARHTRRMRKPLRRYIYAELIVATTALALIWLLPKLGHFTAPITRQWLETGDSTALQAMRFTLAFIAMLIPTTAMGYTLPVLVKSLPHSSRRQIGSLYAFNTLGAIGGILLLEWVLLKHLGIAGSALIATAFCLLAAGIVWYTKPVSESPTETAAPLHTRFALAAALIGFCTLALEVVWFRLLQLYLPGTESNFALMLSVVLIAIAAGSLLARHLLSRGHTSRLWGWAFFAALLTALGFFALSLPVPIWLAAVLMIASPVLCTGSLLPLMAGRASGTAAANTGQLWLANTLGSALGAACGGLWLLPMLGMEHSLYLLAGGYLVSACLLTETGQRPKAFSLCAALAVALLLIPKSLLQTHLDAASASYRKLDGSRVIAAREGMNETLQLLEQRKHGAPYAHRLLTNGYSMSGTARDSLRYMKLFAWLPQSLHADPTQALLISYGVGSTAHTLLSDERLKRLDIVDISRDIIDMSPLIHGEANPTSDPRSQVFIEDGRQYLLATGRRYDLITAEPPPPRMKSIVNLYTADYFALILERLNEGGMVSYWLPVDQLSVQSSQAIAAAFCEVFVDCALWAGSNYNWMLVGSHQAEYRLDKTLWSQPETYNELAALGLEQPGALLSSFLADNQQLKEWIGSTPALRDQWPQRLQPWPATATDIQAYAHWADNLNARDRFATSTWLLGWLEDHQQAEALALYDLQPILNNELPADPAAHIGLVHQLLTQTPLRTPVYWLLDSDIQEQRIIDRQLESAYQPGFAYPLGVRAMVEDNFPAAESLFVEALQQGDNRAWVPAVYSLCRQNHSAKAKALAAQAPQPLSFACW